MSVADLPIAYDRQKLAAFCRARGIRKMSLFGSVLRDDFRPDSDLDFFFTPGPGFERKKACGARGRNHMAEELSGLLGRRWT